MVGGLSTRPSAVLRLFFVGLEEYQLYNIKIWVVVIQAKKASDLLLKTMSDRRSNGDGAPERKMHKDDPLSIRAMAWLRIAN